MKRNNIITLVFVFLTISGFTQNISFTKNMVTQDFDGPAGLTTKDINGDNKPDIICAGMDADAVGLWINNGDIPISWTYIPIDENVQGAIYVSTGDINGDESIDIAVAAWDAGHVIWYENNGNNNPEFTKHIITDSFTQAHEVNVNDIDNDGDMDILGVSAGLNSILLFENTGGNPITWVEHTITDDFAGARSVDALDIDGDNDIDICGAALIDNEVSILYNEGGNPIVWQKQIITNDFIQSHKVQLADIDNDGEIDILGTAYSSGIKWWRNNGADSISWETNNITGNATTVIAYAVDLDLDSDNDIIATAQGSGYVAYFENEGNNTLDFSFTYLDAFPGAWPLHYSDIDGDGDYDIIAGGNSSDELRLYQNDFTTSTNPKHELKEELNVSPIPASNKINYKIKTQYNYPVEISIFDISGSLMKSNVSNSNNNQMDISDLKCGIYTISGKFKNKVIHKKFVKY